MHIIQRNTRRREGDLQPPYRYHQRKRKMDMPKVKMSLERYQKMKDELNYLQTVRE